VTGVGDTPRDLGEYIRETRRRLVALERRQMPSVGEAMPGGHFYGETRVGYLDGWYRGGGPAKVRIGSLDNALTTTGLTWRTPYIPNKGRVVSLVWNGTTWEIAGQPEVAADGSGFYNLLDSVNSNAWGTYNTATMTRSYNETIGATRLPTGLIMLTGLLYKTGTINSGDVICTLPPICRPGRAVILSVNYGDAARAITINTNGTIVARTAWGSSQYLNFDGVCFWALDSEATGNWINVGSGGSSYGANYGLWTTADEARFYQDRYGWTWFDGLVKITGTTSADNTNIITLPAAYRTAKELHMTGVANDFGMGFGATSTNGLNWKTNSPTGINGWIGISGQAWCSASGDTLSPWYTTYSYINSWAQNGPTFPNVQWVRRPDGLAAMRGLVSGGANNATITRLNGYPELWPAARRIICPVFANLARARIDIMGDREDGGQAPQDVIPAAGVTTGAWASLDSIRYVP